jgi:hypothetical protein
MPAAFYEFNIEQSSDYLSALRILKPEDGTLFKFLPNVGERFWKNDNSAVNFDIPNEIKLLYPTPSDAFGYLQSSADKDFLTVNMKIKENNTSDAIIQGTTVCKKMNTISTTGDYVSFTELSGSNKAFFRMMNRTSTVQDNNITLYVPSTTTKNFKGKYLYDIELTYKLGSVGSTTQTDFVVRLLQGRVTFNPNITT